LLHSPELRNGQAKGGALRPESTEDRALVLDTTDARVTSTGEVRITQRITCPSQAIVSLQTTVTQVKDGVARTGTVFYVEPGNVFADFECDGTELVTYTLPATVGPGFASGPLSSRAWSPSASSSAIRLSKRAW